MTSTTLEATARWTAAVRAWRAARPDRPVRGSLGGRAGRPGGSRLDRGADAGQRPAPRRADPLLRRLADRGSAATRRSARSCSWAPVWTPAPSGSRWPPRHGPLRARPGRPSWRTRRTCSRRPGQRPAAERRQVEARPGRATGRAALLGAGLDSRSPGRLARRRSSLLPPRRAARADPRRGRRRSSRPGSQLGFDIVNGAVLTSPYTKPWVDMQAAAGAPWLGTLEDPAAFLAERGWAARLTQAGQPDANHGRWTPPGRAHRRCRPSRTSWFVTARRPN